MVTQSTLSQRQAMLLASILAATALTGCSDPTQPTKANFKRALNEYYQENRVDCIKEGIGVPAVLSSRDKSHWRVAAYEAFLEAGLLSVADHEHGFEYTLSDSGHSYYDPARHKFCFGRRLVARVDNFTAPTEFGQTISEVYYQYRLKEVPEWVAGVVATFEQQGLQHALVAPQDDTVVMVQTANGWMHNAAL